MDHAVEHEFICKHLVYAVFNRTNTLSMANSAIVFNHRYVVVLMLYPSLHFCPDVGFVAGSSDTFMGTDVRSFALPLT